MGGLSAGRFDHDDRSPDLAALTHLAHTAGVGLDGKTYARTTTGRRTAAQLLTETRGPIAVAVARRQLTQALDQITAATRTTKAARGSLTPANISEITRLRARILGATDDLDAVMADPT